MDVTSFRNQMPVTDRWSFFDHAAVAPLSRPAVESMKEYADDLAMNGVLSFERWSKRIDQSRHLVGRLLNADPVDVAFVPNTTAGIGMIAEGFPWQPGDNVITIAEEYPSNQYPWINLRDRGVDIRSITSRGNRIAIDDIRDAMNQRTRVLAISSVEFASGYRNDLGALGEMCTKKGIFLFVDAIQSLGVLPMDVSQLPIDALAADGHKWLLGPEGAGLLWVRRHWLDRLRTIGVGWNSVVGAHDFGTIDFRLKPHSGRWEGGTYNAAGIVGLGASLNLLLETGIPVVAERVIELTDEFCRKIADAGWTIFSSRDRNEKSGIVSVMKEGVSPWEAKKRCLAAGIVVNVRAGRIRVSPHCYNTVKEIHRLVEVLGRAA